MRRRPQLWALLALPCVLGAAFFTVRGIYFWAVLLAVAAGGFWMRAWEERKPPDR